MSRTDSSQVAATVTRAAEVGGHPVSASKQRGTVWESRIVAYLREKGWPHVERRTLSGAKDRGDIAGIVGVVIEAKNEKRTNLAGWIDEAELEAANDNAHHGVVWAHRRGHASPARGYVVMSGETYARLLTAAGFRGAA